MKLAVHVTFFYDKNRVGYLNDVINNLLELPEDVTIYIYGNKRICFKNKKIKQFIFGYRRNFRWQFRYNHTFNKIGFKLFIHPYYLSWENRNYVEKFIDKYDVQMYLEDDIKFTKANFEYWFKNHEKVIKQGYNLGFLRVENDEKGNWFYSDLWEKPQQIILIDGVRYLLNSVNPYCAFWIYDKKELSEFIKSKEWKFNFVRYNIREKSSIGWHGKDMSRYKGSVIPLLEIENKLIIDKGCIVHHLPNNYIGHEAFCTIKHPLTYDI
jgi:hypothetical protein